MVGLRRASNPAVARRRMETVQLGESDTRQRDVVAAAVRQMRLRWVAATWRKAASRIASCCAELMEEVARGKAEIEAAHSRLAAQSYFAAPLLPVSLANCRSANCRRIK